MIGAGPTDADHGWRAIMRRVVGGPRRAAYGAQQRPGAATLLAQSEGELAIAVLAA